MPNAKYKGKGFLFEAGLRSRGTRSYLSSIVVHDQRFIRADGHQKPADNSPDLRINVNNPFKGVRFSENDILFLDKNRTFQIRSGTYNATRFDRLMEDFNFQYLKNIETVPNLNEQFDQDVKTHIEHSFLEQAVNKFNEISGISLTLDFIQNWYPFKAATFSEKKDNNLQISLNALGSGYEMIFSILYSFYLSQQSGKDLIAFIDEPELHMHPALQSEFVKFLLEISKTSQIILTTHSPLFVKQVMNNNKVKVNVIKRNDGNPVIIPVDNKVLPYVSANEINWLAFNLLTVEFHNELYGFIQAKAINEDENNDREANFDYWLHNKGIEQNKQWIRELRGIAQTPVNRTIQTYIRNTIHHPENNHNTKYSNDELKASIEKMIEIIKTL